LGDQRLREISYVCYETNAFISANNDSLHALLEGLLVETNNQLLKSLFTSDRTNQNANYNNNNYDERYPKPKLNEYLNNEFATDISCGAHHSLVLTNCGFSLLNAFFVEFNSLSFVKN